MQHFSVGATCRTSLASYMAHAKIEPFMTALATARKLLGCVW